MQYGLIETRSEEEFTQKGASVVSAHMRFLIQQKGRITIGLSGGSTPKQLYTVMGQDGGIDWTKVFIFLVDERYVLSDHPDSNQLMVRETLLAHAKIPEKNIVFPNTTLSVEACISDYDKRLKSLLGKDSPDLLILGMGDDGHIASLFPPLDDALLKSNGVLAVHTTTDRFAVHDRISVCLPLLSSAKIPLFFLKGEAKKQVWNEMVNDEENVSRWPAQAVLLQGRAMVVMG